MKFADFFAGLGGFHVALKSLGHECVFACESDETLRALYERNFGIRPHADIRSVDISTIPDHDILCAGFPCQPFSKAGDQSGIDCPKWGDLFDWVLNVVRKHRPKYIILENVPNLQRHNEGRTWTTMEDNLRKADYKVLSRILSPHQFGIPQFRERVFIVGSRVGLDHFAWPVSNGTRRTSVLDILDRKPKDAAGLSDQVIRCLNAWQGFLNRFPQSTELPSFPIWSMEFGATYPFVQKTPTTLTRPVLQRYRGSHGLPLRGLRGAELTSALPPYARVRESRFPLWKIQFIRQNRHLYRTNRKWIDDWRTEILPFPPSLQKLEWNCKGEKRDIWRYVIQFRASGVRIKRRTTAPSLVAMTTTQVPIVAWEKRYMTPRECSRLQSMQELEFLPEQKTKAYKALGNAVNVEIVRLLASSLTEACDGKTVSPQAAPSSSSKGMGDFSMSFTKNERKATIQRRAS